MKRILTSALVLALTIGAANAQTTTTEKHKGHQKERQMEGFKNLNLTADQKTQMKKIHEDFKKKAQDLKKQDNLTVAEMKKRREALHQQLKTQTDAVLTADQKAQLAKSRADWKANGKEGKRGERKAGNAVTERKRDGGENRMGRGADMQKELNLTADQQTKMKSIREDYKGKMENLRADKSLTQDQKKEKMKELMKSQQEAMKTVLTKEQFEKMQAARKEHAARNTK